MKKKHVYISLLVLFFGCLFGYFALTNSAKIGHFKNSKKAIYIIEGTTYDAFVEQMMHDSIIDAATDLGFSTKLKSFKQPKPGRYVITKGMSASSFLDLLRSGNQTPLLVQVDGVRTIYQMASKLDRQLMHDSLDFLQAMLDPAVLDKYGLNEYTASALISPNTYEFYWTITPEDFVKKMTIIYEEYWNEENRNAAKNIGLSPAEVATLASIVKGETVVKSEAPKIAGLYLNRLKKGQKLEADPTVTFASNMKNVARVKLDENRVKSPYDTYQNAGLPPGPIFFTEKIYLDAVLHAEQHNYFFMCAQPKATGYHDFSTNFSTHAAYARVYRNWLNSVNIH